MLGGPVGGALAQTVEPPVAKSVVAASATTTADAAGLPGYTRIKDGVATGRKPALDGFDALKRTGFRTVVYLHPTGADTSAAREVAEKRGLKFAAVETTPASLATAYDTVMSTTADAKSRSVYVFDDDGLRTGAVWYVYFRTAELESADVAKIRARGIGLTDNGDDSRAFWAAAQQLAASR